MQSQAVMQHKSAAIRASVSCSTHKAAKTSLFMTLNMPTLIKPTPHKLELDRTKSFMRYEPFSNSYLYAKECPKLTPDVPRVKARNLSAADNFR